MSKITKILDFEEMQFFHKLPNAPKASRISSGCGGKFEHEGFVIVPDVLTPSECSALEEKMLEMVNQDGNLGKLKSIENSKNSKFIYQSGGIGNAQPLWDLRQNPKIISAFKKVFSDDLKKDHSLVPLIDGIYIAPQATKGIHRDKGNVPIFETLQNPIDPRFRKVYGFVITRDDNETFRCIPKSHQNKKFRDYLNKNYRSEILGHIQSKQITWVREDRFKMDSVKDISEFKKTMPLNPQTLDLQIGSMILWDARLFINFNSFSTENFRFGAFVSFLPRKNLTEEELEYHEKTFKLGAINNFDIKTRILPGKNSLDILPPVKMIDFTAGLNLKKFKRFCEENKYYPTKRDDRNLSLWFNNQKKLAKVGKDYETLLDDLFKNANWFEETRPVINPKLFKDDDEDKNF